MHSHSVGPFYFLSHRCMLRLHKKDLILDVKLSNEQVANFERIFKEKQIQRQERMKKRRERMEKQKKEKEAKEAKEAENAE